MLTVEIGLLDDGKPNEVVEIYLDKDGLTDLQARLSLLQDNKTEHIHLMTESWGLGDLSEKKQNKLNALAHHLKVIVID
jgi:hypothetical protein